MVSVIHGSVFSGGGGFDLASEWMGWENVFHCEWNPFCQTILKYYWPNAKSYSDITKTDFTIWRGKIDILTGGFPCQPFSLAGKRKGSEDNRFLWKEMLRAIREIQPAWVVAENVPGILSIERGMVFEGVCLDLEAEGYEVQPVIIPSVATGADHRRERVFFIAYSKRNHDFRTQRRSVELSERLQELDRQDNGTTGEPCGAIKFNGERGIVDGHDDTNTKSERNSGELRNMEQKNEIKRQFEKQYESKTTASNISEFNTNTNVQGLEERESVTTNDEKKQPSIIRTNGSEHWLEAATRLCTVDAFLSGRLDGIALSKWRTESLKLAGNAVDPDTVYQIFKAIESTYK